ncbi:ABC transporter ATP-binding protein [Fimbriimonas ginsengisoli]|uniref:ABC transporter, ATP binding/permease protein n=1 Tax=Fimbriimonas ginsengisoli Gsoil 348 TaxID=661478 RepID=A0A068NJX6_FIMGI|nr:ABC transporter ATP-binding protein [Fimbriimonas ginsengisoli]AIE83757.1 ABC transporter, ATP binding/permease protein [Fimbriimonas ginsengisoli Gsoil 348]
MTEREALNQGFGYRKNAWKAFLFVLPFLRPHLRRMLLVCLIDISVVLINLATPWFGKTVIDQAFPQRNWGQVATIAASVAGLALLAYLLVGLRNFLYNVTELRLGLDLRRRMYGHLQRLSLDTVESIPVGQQQFRVTTDADRVAHMLVRILPTLTMLVEFALILTAAIYVDPFLTALVLAFLIPWTILFVWVTHYGRVLDRKRLRFCELRDAGILQAASSFSVIKSLGRVRREIRRNGKTSVALQRISAQGYLILVGFEFVTQKLLPYVKTTTIYLYLARKVILGQMTLGMTVPMIAYLGRLSYPLERIVNFACWIWQTMVSAERMMQILQAEPAVQDKPGATKMDGFSGRIVFDSVGFEREGLGAVLSGVSITVEPGRRVAVVGPSGAGKSTLLGLALRYHDPSEGRVLVDGQDLRDVDRTTYLHRCATVMQETFIFGGSLADNLRVVKPTATEEEMQTVLESVELGPWLETLPDRLEQDLDSGQALSVGQRQRIGIARALLVDAPLLLLDEPTAALDAETERQIMETLRRVSANRGTLMVTHRLGTVTDADEIIVLDAGRVVERGTHAELIVRGGLYQEMQRLYRAMPSEPSLQGAHS